MRHWPPPPELGRLHEKCSEFASRHRLPPLTVTPPEATPTLTETCALDPQLVPIKHVEKATAAAEAHWIVVPVAPVRFSVFKSLEPTCAKSGVRWSRTPVSNAAKLLTTTAQRWKPPTNGVHVPVKSAAPP